MSFSVEDAIYIALYGSWSNNNDTSLYGEWATNWMHKMAHLATGIQLADENLHNRAARFMTKDNLAKLDTIRTLRDPHNLFHEWHSRPSYENQ
jgi:hypothetical protein